MLPGLNPPLLPCFPRHAVIHQEEMRSWACSCFDSKADPVLTLNHTLPTADLASRGGSPTAHVLNVGVPTRRGTTNSYGQSRVLSDEHCVLGKALAPVAVVVVRGNGMNQQCVPSLGSWPCW